MLLNIDFESETPIYRQLRDQLITGIAAGALQPQEPLPSVRQLAEDIGINMHTVNKAYNLLKTDGFLVVHKRKGVLVNSSENMIRENFTASLPEVLTPVLAEAFCRGVHLSEINDICADIFNQFAKE